MCVFEPGWLSIFNIYIFTHTIIKYIIQRLGCWRRCRVPLLCALGSLGAGAVVPLLCMLESWVPLQGAAAGCRCCAAEGLGAVLPTTMFCYLGLIGLVHFFSR